METESYENCYSYCTGASYDLIGLAAFFSNQGCSTRLSKYFLHLRFTGGGDVFFFSYGCFVSWGLSLSSIGELRVSLNDFTTDSLKKVEEDAFYYCLDDRTWMNSHETLQAAVIHLSADDVSLKLAISFALAQSIKLEAFEESILEVIKKNSKLPEEIVKRGMVSLNRRGIFKRMGEIFIARSSINISIEYLDTPEYFWANPNLEDYYVMSKKFMDLQPRVAALNQKLDVLHDLLDMLNSQVQHRHSSLLETVIIVLIGVEIVISLLQFHVV